MNEEKITVTLNEEDVQNIINCYEKDIKYIKHLENRIDNAIKYMENYIEVENLEPIIIEFSEVIKILKGVEVICFNQERYFTFEVDDIEGSDNNE